MPQPYPLASYVSALQNLFPRGRVWPRDPDAVQTKLVTGLAGAPTRLDASAYQLLVDAFPPTAVAMLPEWDGTLGLPDPAAGAPPSLAKHQLQVASRFADDGGQSIASYIAWAARFGITITVQNFAPFRAGQSRAGQPDCGADWAYALAIVVPSSVDYAAWDLTMLTDSLEARAPAHGLMTVTLA